jgi:hypothetical protein
MNKKSNDGGGLTRVVNAVARANIARNFPRG